DHLTRTNRIYLEPLAKAAERGRVTGRLRRGELRPNLLGRWFIGEIEPPPKRRFKAPLPAMVPPSDGAKDSILADFRRVQASVTAAVQASADLDLRRIRFHNPLLRGWRVFNLATGFLVICAHERRHLAQAGAVRARPDFPAR
ncbi:MAG: DinB family protein, partial [Thermoanaerobaculia bacterium]